MKNFLALIFLIAFVNIYAQKVELNNSTYEVKKDKIYMDGKEVTSTLAEDEKTAIFTKASVMREEIKQKKAQEKEEKKLEKKQRRTEKEQKQLEKKQRKLEKKQKRAEREKRKLEKKQKALGKAEKNLSKAQRKFDRLKSKGKLSPVDEAKWTEKIQKLTDRVNKAKRKL